MAENILTKILEHKKLEVTKQQQRVSLEELQQQIQSLGRPRNFFKAVTKPPTRAINLIAEIKRSSPSVGLICKDFDPTTIAKQYHQGGADAISVLTDEKFFGGSLDYIKQVKEVVSVPVMRKDFIIDPYQLYESRAAGADAVLLIAEALAPGLLMDLLILAGRLNLSVLLEVHKADSLLQCRSMVSFPTLGYTVLGINNRDLETFEVDIAQTQRLASILDNQPGLVSESGIRSRADIEKLRQAGCSAVLIGQTLMESTDIVAKIEELLGSAAPS